ncbi:hypothetical protein C8A01DRAFT_47477 [Parachaetomium inaequale]|uniref:Uncharacterized protein n=1 Tax=Parachaetomium inaequale TaxID=2588326 RepID=A0AAN6SQW4_9PEZI|nr:hypothetical protein C8A01DRAFT_47477 [Parachaetomium inaequale]
MTGNNPTPRTDDLLAPYIRLTEADRSPNTPHIRLCMEASPRLSTTLPYHISFTLQRDDDDGDPRCCIILWDPSLDVFIPSNLVLLRHVTDADGGLAGLEKADIEPDFAYPLGARGGAKRGFGAAASSALPRLVIPGGSRLGFVAEREALSWPERAEHEAEMGFASANDVERDWRYREALKRRAPDLVKASERVPGAPIFVVTLNCPPTLTLHKTHPCSTTFEVQVTVAYDAPTSENPVTFHTYDFQPWLLFPRTLREGYALYKHCDLDEDSDEQEWQICDTEDDCGAFAVYDGPDIKVCVREDGDFVSLRPRESWTAFPDDVTAGDMFRYQFRGITDVDWWDWGHIENEHAETMVTLPCWRGRAVDPAGNGGRPKLVVPASNPAEFRVVG